jgi:hypothetical protein
MSINLNAFGYKSGNEKLSGHGDEARANALQKAMDSHGVEQVLIKMNELKVFTTSLYNVKHRFGVCPKATAYVDELLAEVERDILYVLSKKTIEESEEEDDVIMMPPIPAWLLNDTRNARFNECMKYLNLKQGYSRKA